MLLPPHAFVLCELAGLIGKLIRGVRPARAQLTRFTSSLSTILGNWPVS